MQNLMGLGWLLPGVNHKIDFGRNVRGLAGMPRRLLLIGHDIPSQGEMQRLRPMQVSTLSEAMALAGRYSMLFGMWAAAYSNADKGLPIDIMAVAMPDGEWAQSRPVVSLSSGATAAEAGEVMFYVHGLRASVSVTTDDTPTSIASNLVAAINALGNLLQVHASVPADAEPGEFKLAARWSGASGNDIDLRGTYYDDDRLPSNVVLTIPAMSGGTLNPDLSNIANALAGYRATEIVCPWLDSTTLTALEAELTARWGHANMSDGQALTVMRGTSTAVKSWMTDRNSEQCHTVPVLDDCTNPWQTAAMVAAGIESIAASDPSMHYLGRQLVGYMGPRRGAGYTEDERNDMLKAGLSPLEVAADGTATIGRMVTHYTHNTQGADDKSRRELPWVKFMSYYRWYTVTQFRLQYSSGWKLDPSATEPIPGVPIMTAALAVETMVGNYTQLIKAGFVQQDLQAYIDSVRAEIDAPNCLVMIEDEPKMLSPYYQTGITSFPVA